MASSYTIVNGRMYHRSISQPLLRCLNVEEQQQALETVHEGICGEHLVGRSFAFKILRQGFFWMTLRADAIEYAKKCKQCQLFANVLKQPPEKMTYVLSPIMFAMWAIDIVGILPTSTKEAKYCIISIDYMTKWVEARPLSAITEEATKNRVAHPKGNGAIEAANKIIFQGIKKRLGEANGRWAKELPWVLWAYRTTPRSSTGETPFRLAYGMDALVPIEVGLQFYRTEVYNVEINNFRLRANVDLLEEERVAAHRRNIKYLLQATQHYDSGIKKGHSVLEIWSYKN
ncbi:uncharacterized protein LOC141695995 [Apium graveolens]|uniref:uncharacterized protein LOC141695995 n=1 Tax=Apium graveolens TaxID=4045 RepID=UPI003D7AD9A6